MHKQHKALRIALRGIAVLSTCISALVVLPPLTPAGAVTNPVSVTMSASPSPVASNSSLTYTIVATDTEPQQVNVRLTDQLTGLTNVVLASSRGYCSLSSNLVTCDAGSMPGQGSTWTVTITGLVTAGNGTYLNNTATVTGDWSPQNTSQTFSVPATTSVLVSNGPLGGLPDLSVSIIAPSTANAGSSQTYQVVVNNSGGSNASDIQTNITLPPGFSLQPSASVSGTSLFQCVTSLPSIVCTGGAVNAGANATITIPLVVSGTTPPPSGLQWTTTAVVDPENAIPESNELNNTAQQTLLAPGPAASPGLATFTKTATSPIDSLAPSMPTGSQVRPGDLLTYSVKATNTSTKDTLTRVQITDGTQGLDQASVSVKSTDPKFICANSNSQVKCAASNNNYTLGTNGGNVTVTITGKVVQPPSSIITNTATLQGLQNKVTITRTASVTTIVRPAIDLTVTNYDTCVVANGPNVQPPSWRALLPDNSPGGCNPSGTFRARNQFDYLVTVGNSGINDAAGVTIRIPLPNDVIYEGYENLGSADFSCPAGSAPVPPSPNFVLVCTGGTVPGQATSGQYPGATRQLRIHLTAPNSTGAITAITTVDPYNTIAESDETNNTFTTTTPIATGVNLTVEQSSLCPRDTRQPSPNMCNPVAPSGTLIYHILVTNVGTQDSSGIKVTDTLPAGAKFRSAKEVPPFFPTIGTPYTPTHNVTCSSDGASLVTCIGGRLAGIYAAFGGPLLPPPGTPDSFMIEVKAFAPAPYGPSDSPNATGSPILNQVQVDPDNTIPEFIETNAPTTDNINLLETNVGIPPAGDWGTYNELDVVNAQTNPGPVCAAPSSCTPVAPNGTLDYTLTVRNWGSDPVSNVTVTDNVPGGARLRDVTADALSGGTGGFGCSFANGVVTCTNGALAASTSVGTPAVTHIVIRLFAPPTVNASTTQYTNHAVVDPGNAIAEADETNNVSDVSLTVALPTPSGPYDPPNTFDPSGTGAITGGGANTFNDLTVLDQQVSPVDGTGPCVNVVTPQQNCAPVAPNGTLKYDLTVANRGTDPASNITVADYIPQGSRFRDVSADALSGGNGGFVCAFNAGVVTCTNGNLQGGNATTKIHILLYAPDAVNYDGTKQFTNVYTNHAVVDPGNAIPEGDETNNTSDVQLLVQNAPNGANAYNELQISTPQEFPDPNSGPYFGKVAPAGTLVYDVIVSNQGSDPATNVTFKDYLPTGTTYRLAKQGAATTGSGGFVCSQNSGVVTCNNGTLASGGQATIKVTLFAPSQPSSPGSLATITNQVVVDPDNVIPEGNETNNTATQDTTVSGPDPTTGAATGAGAYQDLTVTDGGSPTTGTPDDQFVEKFNIQNLGTDDVFNATFRVALPAGTTFVAAGEADGTDPGRFVCSQDSGVVTCTGGTVRGTLNGGATRTVNVALLAPHKNIAIITQAQVDPDNAIAESDESNNAIRVNTFIQSVINLSIELDQTGITQSQYGTITGRIKNNVASGSGEDAHNVLSVWNLPVGVTVEDVQAGTTTPSGTSCSTATDDTVNQVTCVTDTLAAGATLEFNFYVFQNNDQTDNDNAVVNGNHATVESDDGNDTDSTVQSQVTQ
ncbi:MAG TPA: CARDB domain-containing protein [Mycobacteriales bacterium]|nr:CARDB domain-containing protein [Mycobacteriales bacterium]